jgi:hypothetical protein
MGVSDAECQQADRPGPSDCFVTALAMAYFQTVRFQKSRTGAELRVCRNLAETSSGTAVLVDESAEDVVALDVLCWEGDDVRGVGRVWDSVVRFC